VPGEKLVIEYDERQHFTLPRAASLKVYPPAMLIHFDRQEWITCCERIHANDPTPPYRDEQRAFYDSLRDILAPRNGMTLVRIRDGEYDWTAADAERHLDAILSLQKEHNMELNLSESDRNIVLSYVRRRSGWWWEDMVRDILSSIDKGIIRVVGHKVRKNWGTSPQVGDFNDAEIMRLVSFIRVEAGGLAPSQSPRHPVSLCVENSPSMLDRLHAERCFQKIALISHDYTQRDSAGLWDYSEHFRRINEWCDQEGCDTILFSLYSWDRRSTVQKDAESMFKGLRHVRRIVLEAGDLAIEHDGPSDDLLVEVWLRDVQAPFLMRQRFATSKEAAHGAGNFIADLPNRQVGEALVMICGETNLASLNRALDEVSDSYRFLERLTEMRVSLILNPIHDYMQRYEMPRKRQYYSTQGRTVVSVWNMGKGRESGIPWTVFHDGVERTVLVQDLPCCFTDRPDIRIGVLSLKDLHP